MLHWNSLWAPTQPDGKTALETAPVWKDPWPAEQFMAWQTLSWEQWLNTSHTWVTFWVATWAMPAYMAQGMTTALPQAANDPVLPDALPPKHTARPARRARSSGGH